MSKIEFLQNVKTARNLLTHRVSTDPPQMDAQTVAAQLAAATIWLTPSALKGFDVREFSELSVDARVHLKENVEQFLEVAKAVPPTKPATREQTERAMSALLNILEILTPYLAVDQEMREIRGLMRTLDLPKEVLNWDLELGLDSTEDPAVWIWLFVDDATAARSDFADLSLAIRDQIHNTFATKGITRWPYIRFRAAAEQRAL